MRDLPFITMQQVKKLFFCERDESGLPRWMGEGEKGPTYEELFRQTWRRRGASKEQQDQLWIGFFEHQQSGGTEEQWRNFVDGVMGWSNRSTSQ